MTGGTCSAFPATRDHQWSRLYLRRGMAAGLLAGLLAGLFAFLVGEPMLDRAIALEEASAGAHHEEIFTRPTQKVGLFFATGLFGVTCRWGVRSRLRVLSRTSGSRQRLQAQHLPGRCHLRGCVLDPLPQVPGQPAIRRRSLHHQGAHRGLLHDGRPLAPRHPACLARRKDAQVTGCRRPATPSTVGAGLAFVVSVLFLLLPAAPISRWFPAGRSGLSGSPLSVPSSPFGPGSGVLFGALCERASRKGGRL